MRWAAKAGLQKALSGLPRNEVVNYLLQRHVTRSLPRSDQSFLLHARETLSHFDGFRRELPEVSPSSAHFYEFGAGWDLITALIYYALGVGRQTLVDLRPHLRLEIVEHTLGQLRRHWAWLGEHAPVELRPLPDDRIRSAAELEGLGIEYLAPRDARATGFPAASFDFVSSTFTLEHIGRDDISAILRECGRILRPSGVLSSAIDMQDHYSYRDPRISAFNFLKFGDHTWRLINSTLHYQNRLRASDYDRLFAAAGFDVVERRLTDPCSADRETIAALPLAPRFLAYDVDDLAVRAGLYIARPISAQRRAGRLEQNDL